MQVQYVNVSKYFLVDNKKKNRMHGYVSVYYDSIDVDHILDISI